MNSIKLVLSLFLLVLINGIIANEVEVVGNVTNNLLGIKYNDNICVLIGFDQANISIVINDTQNVFTANVTNFDDWLIKPAKSSCDGPNQTQILTMANNGNYLTFKFNQKKDTDKEYGLSQLTYEWSNMQSTNNTITADTVMSYMKPDLKPKGTLLRGTAFECKHRYKFILNNTNSIYETRVSIVGLKFSAFRNSTKIQFNDNRIFCDISKKIKPGNDIIPIAVGGVLTAILVISLIGYFVIRAKKS